MKISEFKRLLVALGATFAEGKRHTKVYLNGRQSVLPRHSGRDIGERLRQAILKQLGQK